LRSETSLVQTIGRAARHVEGRVLLYADKMTGSLERALAETNRRRERQVAHNTEHGITPASVQKNIADLIEGMAQKEDLSAPGPYRIREAMEEKQAPLYGNNLRAHIDGLESEMREAAADLEFETAARLRDEIKRLRETELAIADDPFARQAAVDARVEDNTGIKSKAPAKKRRRQRKGP
jgi:excinuclease ABC subunit B